MASLPIFGAMPNTICKARGSHAHRSDSMTQGPLRFCALHLALAFWRATVLEAAIYRERLTRASRGTALERVAHLLCEQLARREAVGVSGARLPLSQIDVADGTGLSVVHVNRTIQTLRSLNVLSRTSQLEVIDRKQLAQVTKFDGRYLDMPQLLSNWAVRVEEGRPGAHEFEALAATNSNYFSRDVPGAA